MDNRGTSDKGIRGIFITSGSVHMSGDVVGGDKIRIVPATDVGNGQRAERLALFDKIRQSIDSRPDDPRFDKIQVKEIIARIEEEVDKDEPVDANMIERWLQFLAGISHDVFEMTVVILANPNLAIPSEIQRVAREAHRNRFAT